VKPARHDPRLALRTLDRHGVAFVLIGGLAGRAAGSPTVTNAGRPKDRIELEILAAVREESDRKHR
jgi:hypothetical protein